MLKISLLFIILKFVVFTSGAPHHDFHKKEQNIDHKLEVTKVLSDQKQLFEDHSYKSSEEHLEYNDYHQLDGNYDNCDDCDDESSSNEEERNHKCQEITNENLDQNFKGKSLNSSNSNGTEVQGVHCENNKDSTDKDKGSGHNDSSVDETPLEIEIPDNSEPNKDTANPPQNQVTEDIFTIPDQTTARQSENDDKKIQLHPRITKNLDPQRQQHFQSKRDLNSLFRTKTSQNLTSKYQKDQQNPSRKRRHVYNHGNGFSYGYTIYHYVDPHDYDYRTLYMVPLHTSYSYVPHTPSPVPKTPEPNPPIHHINSDGSNGENDVSHGHDYDDSTEKFPTSNDSNDVPRETSSKKSDENAVIPLATTLGPTTLRSTESSDSNKTLNFLEESDNTEYPEEVLKVTEMPNEATDAPETTDNVFLKVLGIE